MGRVAHQSPSCTDFGQFGLQLPCLEMGHEKELIIKGGAYGIGNLLKWHFMGPVPPFRLSKAGIYILAMCNFQCYAMCEKHNLEIIFYSCNGQNTSFLGTVPLLPLVMLWL